MFPVDHVSKRGPAPTIALGVSRPLGQQTWEPEAIAGLGPRHLEERDGAAPVRPVEHGVLWRKTADPSFVVVVGCLQAQFARVSPHPILCAEYGLFGIPEQAVAFPTNWIDLQSLQCDDSPQPLRQIGSDTILSTEFLTEKVAQRESSHVPEAERP